ncbi:MAG TPA: PEP-CTERM sorting domain-containing protein [Longimicrobiales bacterium]|nr:PEP-CTERM sorting domain-containing protein [Longimicrobiales bacterium]
MSARRIVFPLLLVTAFALPAPVAAQIGFDDVVVPQGGCVGPGLGEYVDDVWVGDYAGFTWTNMYACDDDLAVAGFAAAVVSGSQAAVNGFGTLGVFAGSLFNFNSAYFTTLLPSVFTLTVRGWRDGGIIYTQDLALTQTATLYDIGFTGVDLVTLGNPASTPDEAFVFAVDDVNVTVTPEPASLLLITTGVLGIAVVGRRRQRSNTA